MAIIFNVLPVDEYTVRAEDIQRKEENMKNVDWNRYDDVAEALRDHLRVCLVSDGYVSSVAPCGRSSIKTIVREYMRRYDIPTDAEPGWVDGRVEIYSRRKGAEEEVDAAPFWFNEKDEWTLTYPAGELRADGYRY
jgi:S-methylmethionine-dependent homocysteine/selenocysteine methylase